MTSVNDIKFEDIRLFLISNDIAVPRHRSKDEIVKTAEKMILSGKTEYNYPDVIIDFIIASNFVNDNKRIKMYKLSEIQALSDDELIQLYRKLSNGEQLEDVMLMEKSVINILNFLHKLEYDKLNINTINADVFSTILRNNDINDIINLCNSSRDLSKTCEGESVRDVLLDKISATDNFDLSNYSNKQLLQYFQILPYKKSSQLVSIKGYYSYFNGEKFVLDADQINQIIVYRGDPGYYDRLLGSKIPAPLGMSYAALLYTNGSLNVVDLVSRIVFSLETELKFLAIFKSQDNFIALTPDGDYYYFKMNLRDPRSIDNIYLLPKNSTLVREYKSGEYIIGNHFLIKK